MHSKKQQLREKVSTKVWFRVKSTVLRKYPGVHQRAAQNLKYAIFSSLFGFTEREVCKLFKNIIIWEITGEENDTLNNVLH